MHFLSPWGAPAAVGKGQTASVQNDRTPHTARRDPTAERSGRTPILIQAPQEPLAQRKGRGRSGNQSSAPQGLTEPTRQKSQDKIIPLLPWLGSLGATPLSGLLVPFGPCQKEPAPGCGIPQIDRTQFYHNPPVQPLAQRKGRVRSNQSIQCCTGTAGN